MGRFMDLTLWDINAISMKKVTAFASPRIMGYDRGSKLRGKLKQFLVFILDIINGELFCGHDRGTYLISENRQAKRISNIQGTWKVKSIPNNPKLLIQGNYP